MFSSSKKRKRKNEKKKKKRKTKKRDQKLTENILALNTFFPFENWFISAWGEKKNLCHQFFFSFPKKKKQKKNYRNLTVGIIMRDFRHL